MKKYGIFVNGKLIKTYSRKKEVTAIWAKTCLWLGDQNEEVLVEVVELNKGIILTNANL